MSLFLTKEGKRKSPKILAYFFGALLFLVIFVAAYAFLTTPLHNLPIANETVLSAVETLLIALVGTAGCCLLFFLPDKSVVPYSFVGLAVIVAMFYVAAFALDAAVRPTMLYLSSMYGLGPAVVGNLISWTIYWKLGWKTSRRI